MGYQVRSRPWIILTLLLAAFVLREVAAAAAKNSEGGTADEGGGGEHAESVEDKEGDRYEIAVFEWEEVKLPLTVSIWIICASIAKICKCFHEIPRPGLSPFQCST